MLRWEPHLSSTCASHSLVPDQLTLWCWNRTSLLAENRVGLWWKRAEQFENLAPAPCQCTFWRAGEGLSVSAEYLCLACCLREWIQINGRRWMDGWVVSDSGIMGCFKGRNEEKTLFLNCRWYKSTPVSQNKNLGLEVSLICHHKRPITGLASDSMIVFSCTQVNSK